MKKIKLIAAFSLLFLLGLGQKTFSQITLAQGDVALLGANSVGTDKFSWTITKAIASGTVLYFTDNGFTSTTAGRIGEGFLRFTAASNYPAGTVFTWANGGTVSSEYVSLLGGANNNPTNLALNATGEQMFIFQSTTLLTTKTAVEGAWGATNLSTLEVLHGLNYGAPTGSAGSDTTFVPATGILPAANFVSLPGSTVKNLYYSPPSGSSATFASFAGSATAFYTSLTTVGNFFTSATEISFPTKYFFATGSLAAVNTTYGSASATPTSFQVTGTGMGTNTIGIAALGSFQYSITVGGTYTSSLTLSPTSGSINSTVFVRLAATATVAGSPYSGDIAVSSTGMTTVNMSTASSTVNKLTITTTGITANNKIYDGATTATLSGTPALSGVIAGDVANVTIGGTATANFSQSARANGLAVTVTGYTISGSASGNYTLTQPTGLTANITAKSLTLSGLTANNKIYDSTTAATLSGTPALVGVIAADVANVTLGGTVSANFSQSNIGNGLAVTVTGYTIGGSAATNYSLTQPTGLSANITVKNLTISGLTVNNKIYDATTTATLSGTPVLVGVVAADVTNVTLGGTVTANFSQSTIGTGLAVTVTGYAISGSAAGNYSLTQPIGFTANITAKNLTISGLAANNKVYDATTNAIINGTPALVGVVAADVANVTLGGTETANFSQSNVGTALPVTVSGYSISGSAAANYSLIQPTGLTANITAINLTISGLTADNKVYDGTTTATLNGTPSLVGVISAEIPNVTMGGTATANFSQSSIGTALPVTVSGYTIGGSASGNYSLTQPTGLSADITSKGLTISGITADNKGFDGTTAATLSGTPSLVGVVTADLPNVVLGGTYVANFSQSATGTNLPVTVSGYTISGSAVGNYLLTQPTGLSADIIACTPTTGTTTITACDTYIWTAGNGNTYTVSGSYPYVTDCHTETLNLTINNSTSNTTTATACDTYTWSAPLGNGQTYTTSQSGITFVSTNAAGCSHTETLNLTINNSTSNTTTAIACNTYTWSAPLGNGQTYTTSQSGVTFVSTNAAGCPHTETLNLTINNSTSNTTTATACNTYTWSSPLGNGQTYTTSQSGVTFVSTNAAGCPHTETLNLTINNSTSNTTTATACNSYTWSAPLGNGQTYTTSQSGITFVSTNAAGCSHTETLNLTINNSTSNTTTATACDTYTWSAPLGNGQTYTTSQSGVTFVSTNAAGCSHTETLNLTINNSTSNTTTATACDTYTWSAPLGNGQTYTTSQSGITFVSTNAAGCSHTETLNLTINNSTSNTTTATACNTYTWSAPLGNGQTYTTSQSGVTFVSTNAAGCPHTETLNLTITPSTTNTTTVSACDAFTWTAGNGNTYTVSGNYNFVNGCHTETLALTITPSTSNTTTIAACDTYTWTAGNGNTYTQSGNYPFVSGCHTETLALTITPSTTHTTTVSACDTYIWASGNGNTYTESGNYLFISGCHTETLALTITPSTSNTTTIAACNTYTWTSGNGNTYTTSGNYTYVNGCHTEMLALTINTNTIVAQPSSTLICKSSGATTSFTILSSSTTPAYQWYSQQSGDNPITGVWTPLTNGFNYSGATSATLNITKTEPTIPQTGTKYRVLITSADCGSTITSDIVTITDIILPDAPTSLVLTDDAAASPSTPITAIAIYVGTDTQLRLTASPVDDVLYKWTLPVGVTSTSTNSSTGLTITTNNTIFVKFTDVGSTAPLVIYVQTVSASGCSSDRRASAPLRRLLPAAPTLSMNNGVTTASIGTFGPYVGTNTVLRLSVTPNANGSATSFEWELPTGVNRLTALSGGTITTSTNSIEPYIFINFSGVTNLNTYSYATSTGVLTHVLRIGVKAKNGVGVSVTNNSTLVNPATTSTAKLLTLTATPPLPPATLTLNNGVNTTAITVISKLIAEQGTFRLSAAPSAQASSYEWELPAGVARTTDLTGGTIDTSTTSSAPFIYVKFTESVPAGFIQFGSKAVNGIGNSVTNNSALTPSTTSTAKVLRLTTAIPLAPSSLKLTEPAVSETAITVVSKYIGTSTTLKLSANISTLANFYQWELPEGVTRTDENGLIITGLTSNDPFIYINFLNFTVTGTATVSLPLGIKAVNGVGASITENKAPNAESKAKLLIVTAGLPNAVSRIAGETSVCNRIEGYDYVITAPTGANYYTISAPAGAIVTSSSFAGNDSNILTTSDVTFNVVYSGTAAFLSTDRSLIVRSGNAFGVATNAKSVALSKVACPLPFARIEEVSISDEFEVVAYPNPYSSVFQLNFTNATEDQIDVKVYDMNGRLIDVRQFSATEMDNQKIGSEYPSGIYNVIVTQGANLKTLRVVKR